MRTPMPCGPSWTFRKWPTPCPVPWLRISCHSHTPSPDCYALLTDNLKKRMSKNSHSLTPAGSHLPSPSSQSGLRAKGSRRYPVVPFGNTARSIAMWPWSTRVNARFSSGVGVPKCCVKIELGYEGEREEGGRGQTYVRVTSVVPSRYCAVNSHKRA